MKPEFQDDPWAELHDRLRDLWLAIGKELRLVELVDWLSAWMERHPWAWRWTERRATRWLAYAAAAALGWVLGGTQ